MVSAGKDRVTSSEEFRTFKDQKPNLPFSEKTPKRVKSHFSKHPVCGGSFGQRYQSKGVFLQQESYQHVGKPMLSTSRKNEEHSEAYWGRITREIETWLQKKALTSILCLVFPLFSTRILKNFDIYSALTSTGKSYSLEKSLKYHFIIDKLLTEMLPWWNLLDAISIYFFVYTPIAHLPQCTLFAPPPPQKKIQLKILHKHCFQFLLGRL